MAPNISAWQLNFTTKSFWTGLFVPSVSQHTTEAILPALPENACAPAESLVPGWTVKCEGPHNSPFIMTFSTKICHWAWVPPCPAWKKYTSLAGWGKMFTFPTKKDCVRKKHLQGMGCNRKGLIRLPGELILASTKTLFQFKALLANSERR